jgi:hypothetical protein
MLFAVVLNGMIIDCQEMFDSLFVLFLNKVCIKFMNETLEVLVVSSLIR